MRDHRSSLAEKQKARQFPDQEVYTYSLKEKCVGWS